MRPYLVMSALAAALGGLLFGFDTAVISGANDALKAALALDETWLGAVVASALVGTVLGSMVAGFAADHFGRRASLILISVLYLLSAVGSALAWDKFSMIGFRAIGGLGVGGSSIIAAMYIAEISPARRRGVLVGTFQLNIVIGILVAFLSNYLITEIGRGIAASEVAATTDEAARQAAYSIWLNDRGWRWMFAAEIAPALAFLGLLLFTPRSPRWLVMRGREDEARRVLARVGTDEGDVEQEIEAIRRSLASAIEQKRERLLRAAYRRPIFLVLLLATFNQLSGINAVLYYAPTIFENAGASGGNKFLFPVALGAVNLVFTLIGLSLIDRFGRRYLLLIGSVGYVVSLATAATSFFAFGPDFGATSSIVVLVALALFIASHAVGQGAVIWVYIGEVFPNAVRGKGQTLGGFTHWVWAAVLTFFFPPVLELLGGGPVFAVFGAFMILQFIWVYFFVPETKGVPLEQIEQALGIRDGRSSGGTGS